MSHSLGFEALKTCELGSTFATKRSKYHKYD